MWQKSTVHFRRIMTNELKIVAEQWHFKWEKNCVRGRWNSPLVHEFPLHVPKNNEITNKTMEIIIMLFVNHINAYRNSELILNATYSTVVIARPIYSNRLTADDIKCSPKVPYRSHRRDEISQLLNHRKKALGTASISCMQNDNVASPICKKYVEKELLSSSRGTKQQWKRFKGGKQAR